MGGGRPLCTRQLPLSRRALSSMREGRVIPPLTSPRLYVSTPTVFMEPPSTGRGVDARYGCRGARIAGFRAMAQVCRNCVSLEVGY